RIAAVAGEEAAHRARTLDRLCLAVQASMGVEHESLRFVGGSTAKPLIRQCEDLLLKLSRGLVFREIALHPTIVAAHPAVLIGQSAVPPLRPVRAGCLLAGTPRGA